MPILNAVLLARWSLMATLGAAFSALLYLLPGPARSQATEGGDRTLSPYFVVDQATPGVDALPLKSTQVDVKVIGVIADVRVTQRYRNEGSTPIEARYVFPASTRAAVTAMTMRVGDRVVQAQIREKQAARREYEGAKREGTERVAA